MEHTILVVEDEQGIREAIGIYMKNQGYNVILAANGKEGLEKIETNDIHLAIVDRISSVCHSDCEFPLYGRVSSSVHLPYYYLPFLPTINAIVNSE